MVSYFDAASGKAKSFELAVKSSESEHCCSEVRYVYRTPQSVLCLCTLQYIGRVIAIAAAPLLPKDHVPSPVRVTPAERAERMEKFG